MNRGVESSTKQNTLFYIKTERQRESEREKLETEREREKKKHDGCIFASKTMCQSKIYFSCDWVVNAENRR